MEFGLLSWGSGLDAVILSYRLGFWLKSWDWSPMAGIKASMLGFTPVFYGTLALLFFFVSKKGVCSVFLFYQFQQDYCTFPTKAEKLTIPSIHRL